MSKKKLIEEKKRRLRDWWEDPIALGRPVILCDKMEFNNSSRPWDYFTYPKMIIDVLGTEVFRSKIKSAINAAYNNIPELPKAPTGWKINFNDPEHASIIDKVKEQILAESKSTPCGETIPLIRSQAGIGPAGAGIRVRCTSRIIATTVTPPPGENGTKSLRTKGYPHLARYGGLRQIPNDLQTSR